jgi:hypothetical protein
MNGSCQVEGPPWPHRDRSGGTEEPAGTIQILFLGSGKVGYAKYLFGREFRFR